MKRKERRENTRIDYSGVVAYESCSSLEGEGEGPSHRGTGTAVDISERGLCLITDDAMKDMHIVKIRLPMPGVSLQIPTLAMVVWKKTCNGAYRIGMKFVL